MYNGDRARKDNLVGYGFRLKSAYDNRPLKFEEFDARVGQMICVSATPDEYELGQAGQVVEQVIRPTGLLDPEVIVRKIDGQIDDLLGEINEVTADNGRVLITTLTKRMAESLTEYLAQRGVRVRYMHSDIDTLERVEIVNALKNGDFDVLVGINLLREGLDIPQVELVAILDADKEGFLRSESSLIQTIGRAARNAKGRVIMYADTITGSMRRAIDETNRRRKIQDDFNKANGIVPKTIVHETKNTLVISQKASDSATLADLREQLSKVTSAMKIAAGNLDFERAIVLREQSAQISNKIKRLEEAKQKRTRAKTVKTSRNRIKSVRLNLKTTMKDIIIKNARENNLKGVSLTIPRDKLVLFTGISGSGKSSLAFDTILPKVSADTSKVFLHTPVSFWDKWTSRTSSP